MSEAGFDFHGSGHGGLSSQEHPLVILARLDERQAAMARALRDHIDSEPGQIDQVRADFMARAGAIDAKLDALQSKVDDIYTAARVTRWLVRAMVVAIAWLTSWLAGSAGK